MTRKLTLPLAVLMLSGLMVLSFSLKAFSFNPTGSQVPPGERPPIDIRNVPPDAFEQGKIQIKFAKGYFDNTGQQLFEAERNSFVELKIPDIDRLNQQFEVSRYQSLMYESYRTKDHSDEILQRHRDFGIDRWYEVSVSSRANITDVVEAFRTLPQIEIAEPVYIREQIKPVSIDQIKNNSTKGDRVTPNDEFYSLQWGFKNTGQDIRGTLGTPGADIRAEAAWDVIMGNPDVVVAIIDGGIQYNHPDLQANIWPGIGPDGTNTRADDHGTHVAGTVAAMTNNSIGVAGSAGGDGSPGSGVKVMSLDLFDGSHGLNTLGLNVYAADNGAAISQNSWGYRNAGVFNQSDLDGIDYFNAFGGGEVLDGGLTIFAAGNSNNDGQWYPAYYSGAMAVASTDNQDKKSSFSNFGNWIDISAPGTDIASTGSGSSYMWMSGTSMACPHVSGIAALVLSYVPGTMSNQDLWDLLKETADDIDATNPNFAGKLGTGRLNAHNAIIAASAFAGGLQPPASFAAVAINESEVALSWQLNADNNPVVVEWSADGSFGEPGSGQVLYSGTNTSFTHTGLNFATTYYYRAYSVSGNEYSRHTSAQATTPCPSAWEVPFAENFNTSSGIPFCWETSGTPAWTVGTFANGLTGTTGNYAYAEITGNSARTTSLITPTFDFSNVSDVRVEFKHRYNNDRSSATFAYSTNGGSSWSTVQSWSSNTGTTTFNQVVAALAGQSEVKFRWQLSFTGGGPPSGRRSWSVDDVSITGTAAGNIYTITATAGNGGSINPSGNVSVAEGNSQTFQITANSGFEIADVVVDGSSVGAVSSYTFNNVTADHTIAATFEEIPVITYTITASAGAGGTINPSGDVTVVEGNNQSFTISASAGFEIADVLVNGSSVGAVASYTFNNVTADQTIHATFEELEIVLYTITATAGSGGTINPAGTINVAEGDSQSFTITADNGFEVADVLVNGGSVGAVTSYTFTNVSADQSIQALFQELPDDPCVITTLPYTQDFNAAAAIPDCFEAIVQAGATNWQVGTHSSGLSGTTGNYAYFHYQGNQTQVADLVSQDFNLSGYANINISFKHRYIDNRSAAEFYYSTNGGSSWTLAQRWTSSTSNPATFNQTIAALAGQPNVKLMWRLDYGGGGPPRNSRSWSIDDIVITGTSQTQAGNDAGNSLISDLTDSFNFTIFPNPTSAGRLFVKVDQDIENALIRVFDLSGRELMQTRMQEIISGQQLELDVSNMGSGMYFIQVLSQEGTATKMFKVQ